ncbi:glycosyltransferase family 4 protein [Candidatus Woesearchaeota archaeon]|nr:glycosyltransferase family 4 protein [Candidatus Woesearchaeota archaeon]
MKKNKILAVFPVGNIDQYLKKGEFKRRYFNPDNYFDDVHLFNLSSKVFSEEEKTKISLMTGNAKLFIHSLGDYSFKKSFLFRHKLARKASHILKGVNPSVIRSYGNSIEGYLGMYCAKKLHIPFILSMHTHMENDHRVLPRIDKEYSKFIFYSLWKPIEKKILFSADIILCVYKYTQSYVLSMGISKNKTRQMYNRVYLDQYKPLPDLRNKEFTLINVSNMTVGKNQGTLIKAVAPIKDVKLILVGSGPEFNNFKKLANNLNADNVEFIPKINNEDLPKYYNKAHAFITAIRHGGIGIPPLEAMACGLPIITPKPLFERTPELVGDIALVPKNDPESFRKAILKLKNNPSLQKEMSKKSLELMKTISGDKMEHYEKSAYEEVTR